MIATIHVEAWQAAYRGIVPDEYLDSLSIDERALTWREILSTGNETVWIAQESETIVGWISAAASRDADAGAATGEIRAVYVAPGRWRKGVGRALCETAERHLRLGGFIEVTLWVPKDNERAVKFYQSNGFVPDVGLERTLERGGKVLSEVRFRKRLIDR
jgi:GNAT superfamily N-acetyltransferase